MTVMDGANDTVQLSADQVIYFFCKIKNGQHQVLMMNKDKIQRKFSQLLLKDKDLTMFTVTNLILTKKEIGNMVYMALKLKRKIATELLTTYLPTILLLLITFTSIFFEKKR